MASSAYVGLITCAHCGNQNATVHEQQNGTKKGRLYYRCYTEINGSIMRCGTIQCIGQYGQDWIKAHLRPIGQKAVEARPIVQVEKVGEPIVAPDLVEEKNEPVAQEVVNLEPVQVVEKNTVGKISILEFLFSEAKSGDSQNVG